MAGEIKMLGKYELIVLLGSGAMGEVYRGRDTVLGRTVAIKVLVPELSHSPVYGERLWREARALASLNNPHICRIEDYGEENGVRYLVMEYLDGQTLADRLNRGALPLDDVLDYGVQIVDGLDCAHENSIIHRDLKPANIMITEAAVKILDFGFAKQQVPKTMASAQTQTISISVKGSPVGTPQYMAPEVLDGKEADARSDIFSLAAVLYEMLTGHRAIENRGQTAFYVRPISNFCRVPAALDRLINECLSKDPNKRWRSSHDISLFLKGFSQDRRRRRA